MSRAIFLGSFNPPHKGHLNVITSVLNSDVMYKCNIEKIHIIPAYQNPNKPKTTTYIDRYKMCTLLFGGLDNVIIDDIEEEMCPTYTYDLIKRFKRNEDEIIKSDFHWILTYETLQEIINGEWYKGISLLVNTNFIIVVEDENQISDIKYNLGINTHFVKLNNNVPIHSTQIREMIKEGKSIEEYTNNEVQQYIKDNKIYLK